MVYDSSMARKAVKINEKKRAVIVHDSALNVPTRSIADKIGVSHTTIIREQKQLRPQVEAEMERLLSEGLSVSRATLVKFAAYGADSKCKPGVPGGEQWAKVSLDAAKTIVNIPLQAAANSGNIINQLINININPELSKEAAAIKSFIDNQIVDIDQ
jgi:hypothetical protein